MPAIRIFRRHSPIDSLSPGFFSAMVVRPIIAFIGVRISWDMVERKSVFALFAAAASRAAAWSFLLKDIMTIWSKMNRIRRPAETKPISSQFSLFACRSLTGMRLRSVHPPVASTGVKAAMHSSPRELRIVTEPVCEVIRLKSSCAAEGSDAL